MRNKFKMFLVNLLLRYYRTDYCRALNEGDQEFLISKLANSPELRNLPEFLDQCSANARNQYLYSNDPIFKGSILAYNFLKEEILKRKEEPIKKNLTTEEKAGIMRGRGY